MGRWAQAARRGTPVSRLNDPNQGISDLYLDGVWYAAWSPELGPDHWQWEAEAFVGIAWTPVGSGRVDGAEGGVAIGTVDPEATKVRARVASVVCGQQLAWSAWFEVDVV